MRSISTDYYSRTDDRFAGEEIHPERYQFSREPMGTSPKCLIIAAGKGYRLSRKGNSKPLVPLLGIPLIERVILTAKACGLRDFYIVTGYNGEKLDRFLRKLEKLHNIRITRIVNRQWERGNGLSVLKAKEYITENFILLMGDHMFDQEILKQLRHERLRDGDVILAVDYNTETNGLVDPSDVTRVLTNNGRVANIGKLIPSYNAYDTGIFYCSPALFAAVEASITENNDDSLSGAIRKMAREGRVRTFDIKDAFWVDVDSDEAFQKAEKGLINSLKKPSDGPVSRYLNRPLSTRITRHLVKLNISPNQLTLFSFGISLAAAVAFLFPGYLALVVGALLVQLSSVLDGCDGEVARLKFRQSDFGGWFDAVLDRYADAFVLLGLTFHCFNQSANPLHLLIGFAAIIGSFMNSYTADKYDALMKERFRAGNNLRIGRDVRFFAIFLGGILNQPMATLVFLAVLTNLENMRRVVIAYRSR